MIRFFICLFFILCVIFFAAPSFEKLSAQTKISHTTTHKQLSKKKRGARIIFPKGIDTILKRANLRPSDRVHLQQLERSMIDYLRTLQNVDTMVAMREKGRAAKFLLRTMDSVLHIPFSFAYAFDSLLTRMSIIYPADSSFRIFTWQYTIDALAVIKQGVLQMNTTDGGARFFPLIDRSLDIAHPLDTITDNKRWIGAMYYQIRSQDIGRRRVYTLLGIDEHTVLSTRKWIEILRFDGQGKPIFGGNYFYFPPSTPPPVVSKKEDKLARKKHDKDEDKIPLRLPTENANLRSARVDEAKPTYSSAQKRFMIEYQKMTIASLRYDDEMGMIIFDHLAPVEEQTRERKHTYTLDGDYEGFLWNAQKNKWQYVPQVFNFSLQEGQAPVEKPLKHTGHDFFEKEVLRQK